MAVRKAGFLDRGMKEEILNLYRLCDDDFSLPLSQQNVNAEHMMERVFESGEYLGIREGVRDCEVGENEKSIEITEEGRDGAEEVDAGKHLIGCGGYRRFEMYEREENEEEWAEIHGVVIHPEYRRTGLGNVILHALLERMSEIGVNIVEVGTWEGSAGLNLFLTHGFQEVSRYDDPAKRPHGIKTVRLRYMIR